MAVPTKKLEGGGQFQNYFSLQLFDNFFLFGFIEFCELPHPLGQILKSIFVIMLLFLPKNAIGAISALLSYNFCRVG